MGNPNLKKNKTNNENYLRCLLFEGVSIRGKELLYLWDSYVKHIYKSILGFEICSVWFCRVFFKHV
jgi:hypothetical protein